MIPSLIIAGVNAWRLWDEHWEHKSHEPPLEERVEYPYMNIRTKNFFWGDGDKVGLSKREEYGVGWLTQADPFLEPQSQLPQEG